MKTFLTWDKIKANNNFKMSIPNPHPRSEATLASHHLISNLVQRCIWFLKTLCLFEIWKILAKDCFRDWEDCDWRSTEMERCNQTWWVRMAKHCPYNVRRGWTWLSVYHRSDLGCRDIIEPILLCLWLRQVEAHNPMCTDDIIFYILINDVNLIFCSRWKRKFIKGTRWRFY